MGRWQPARRFPLRTAIAAAGLVFFVGAIGLLLKEPWLYPSMGSTAYLLLHDPGQRSARLYNTVVGHSCGIVSGLVASIAFGLHHSSGVLSAAGQLTPARVAAAGIALAATMLLGTWLRASHPPAASTAMIVVLGGFQYNVPTMLAVVGGVVAIAVAGVAVRRLVLPRARTYRRRSISGVADP